MRTNLANMKEGGGLLRIFLQTVLSNDTADMMPAYGFQALPYSFRDRWAWATTLTGLNFLWHLYHTAAGQADRCALAV